MEDSTPFQEVKKRGPGRPRKVVVVEPVEPLAPVPEEPFQEVKKRAPGRPRKVVVAEPAEPLAPVPEEAPAPAPRARAPPVPPISEHSLRDVLDRLAEMEQRLTPKPKPTRAPRRAKEEVPQVVQPQPQVVQEPPAQSGMNYLHGRRSQKSMYHSFMPP
jgi:hypothetical protein